MVTVASRLGGGRSKWHLRKGLKNWRICFTFSFCKQWCWYDVDGNFQFKRSFPTYTSRSFRAAGYPKWWALEARWNSGLKYGHNLVSKFRFLVNYHSRLENGPRNEDVFPIEKWWCSIAMLIYWSVHDVFFQRHVGGGGTPQIFPASEFFQVWTLDTGHVKKHMSCRCQWNLQKKKPWKVAVSPFCNVKMVKLLLDDDKPWLPLKNGETRQTT